MPDERDEPRFAVEGRESMESEETLSRDELGRAGEPVPPASTPPAPYPRQSLLERLRRALRR